MQRVMEGKVEVLVPKTQKIVSKGMPVFYNPEGELSRDISVCAFQVFQNSLKVRWMSAMRYQVLE
jgi:tRNA G26 N,N-dimethylase Trm1